MVMTVDLDLTLEVRHLKSNYYVVYTYNNNIHDIYCFHFQFNLTLLNSLNIL